MNLKAQPTPAPSCARVLMLHGHGQSGQFLSCKTRFLQHPLRQMILRTLHQKSAYSNVDKVEFYYPSGPLPANPDHPLGESNNLWAWGHGDPKLDHISGLKQSIQYIMWLLETHGPFVGIMGFSTGAAIAAMVCSLLEKRRSLADFDIDIPSHPPMEFAVCFSGFKLENPLYAPIYNPQIETPVLHVIGTMDAVIDPPMTHRLGKTCANASYYFFPGTHYVPRSREFLKVLDYFVGRALSLYEDNEDDWEDFEDD